MPFSNLSRSVLWFTNALMTLVPERCSLRRRLSLSSFFLMTPKSFVPMDITTPNRTRRIGTDTRRTFASSLFIENVRTMLPMNIIGAVSIILMSMTEKFWRIVTSPVFLFIMDETPIESISLSEKLSAFTNMSRLIARPIPAETLLLK